MAGLIYFAIGDVHGESRKLGELHAAILERIAFEGAPARIIHLGDYVDRGPDTKGVIERVMALEARFANDASISVKSLKGNHEQMMLDAYDRTADRRRLVVSGRRGGRRQLCRRIGSGRAGLARDDPGRAHQLDARPQVDCVRSRTGGSRSCMRASSRQASPIAPTRCAYGRGPTGSSTMPTGLSARS